MRFSILGPVGVEHGGRSIELPRARLRGLLGFLLLNVGRSVSIDAVVNALWGSDAPASCRSQVHTGVYLLRDRLRHVGVPPVLVGRGGQYCMQIGDDDLDLSRFRRHRTDARAAMQAGRPADAAVELRDGLRLWHGPALGNASGAFVAGARAGLVEQCLGAAEDLVEAELVLGRHEAVVDEFSQLVEQHPLRERLRSQLMVALYRCGRQAEALESYRRLRALLAEEHGLDPGPALVGLEQSILRADPCLDPPRIDVHGAPAAPVPAQLPADLPALFGRDDELARLRLLLDGEPAHSLRAVAIVGPAGVGKTALAVHWAHEHATRFPDGLLYLDLRGFGPGPSFEIGDALARLLDSLGAPAASLPADLDGRAARFRSHLAGRRVLVLLDNAASSAQVRNLLPGDGAAVVLVTSRRRLDGLAATTGVSLLPLRALPGAGAERMLGELTGLDRHDQRLRTVSRLCDRMPLALRIAAARLASGSITGDLGVAELIRELTAEGTRLHGLAVEEVAVRAALQISYDALGARAGRLLRLLGLFPGERLVLPGCAALAGWSATDTAEPLAELLALHLVDRDAGGRYGMHDLVRLYARELAASTDDTAHLDAALGRLFDWYARTALTADLLLPLGRARGRSAPGGRAAAGFATQSAALTWLDAERDNLATAVRVAWSHDWHRLVWRLVDAHWGYLGMRAELGGWVDLARLAARAAGRDGEVAMQAQFVCGAAIACCQMGRYDEAVHGLRESVELWRGIDDRQGETTTLANLAAVYGDMGEHALAVEQLTEVTRLLVESGDTANLAIALNNLAENLCKCGRYAEALPVARRALRLSGESDDLRTRSCAAYALAEAHGGLGDLERAGRQYECAVALARRSGDRHIEAAQLRSHADLLAAAGRTAEARTRWQLALTLLRDLGDPAADSLEARLATHPR